MGNLSDLLDPTLVLKRDLEAVGSGSGIAKPRTAKKRKRVNDPPTHVLLPDSQVRPGVCTVHLEWVGSYIAESLGDRENVTLVDIGDFWDMPSLSLWDKGKREMEGRRVAADIVAGNDAFSLRNSLIPKKKSWRKVKLCGNHENRIVRAIQADAQLDGLLGMHLLDTQDWETHGFLDPVWIDGICYSHYFANRNSSKPLGGQNLETRVRQVGHSFSMGHQQGLKWARVETIERTNIGLSAGSCYLHQELYMTPQVTNYWRGIVVCNEVANGSYDPAFVSLDYLCRRYEGIRLSEFMDRYI